ncbi:MAG: HAD family hydrolase, partial [Anaerolineaceae bacterium]|nr:HAD family hydrolase [Anaerolineaceae bacterium]
YPLYKTNNLLYTCGANKKTNAGMHFESGLSLTITNITSSRTENGQIKTRVVFFDMDHTILDVSPFHRKNFTTVLNKLFGITELEKVVTSGVPMFEVMRRFAVAGGVSEGSVNAKQAEIERMLVENIQTILPQDLHDFVLPGAVQLLETLHKNKIPVGLTTGTLRGVASQLLARAGLLGYFPLTSFGDDCDHRSQIIDRGLEKATWVYGLARESIELVTIGDAPMDIETGKAFSARTIAVTTGTYTEQELKSYDPDFIFPNLADTQAILSAITAN